MIIVKISIIKNKNFPLKIKNFVFLCWVFCNLLINKQVYNLKNKLYNIKKVKKKLTINKSPFIYSRAKRRILFLHNYYKVNFNYLILNYKNLKSLHLKLFNKISWINNLKKLHGFFKGLFVVTYYSINKVSINC